MPISILLQKINCTYTLEANGNQTLKQWYLLFGISMELNIQLLCGKTILYRSLETNFDSNPLL